MLVHSGFRGITSTLQKRWRQNWLIRDVGFLSGSGMPSEEPEPLAGLPQPSLFVE